MISFFEYIKKQGWFLDESSKEERDIEAMRRRIKLQAYQDSYRTASANIPKQAPSPKEKKAWDQYTQDVSAAAKETPNDPNWDFNDEVEQEIRKKTGLSLSHGQLIPNFMDDPKSEADDDRLRELIYDAFEDGLSAEETADMAIEFLKSHGYLR